MISSVKEYCIHFSSLKMDILLLNFNYNPPCVKTIFFIINLTKIRNNYH